MAGRNRNDFTSKDDKYLIAYIATYNPESSGRLGNKLYERLEENAAGKWPWSKNHPWRSWRERYKKNQEYFDFHIRKYKRKAAEKKERSKKVDKTSDSSPANSVEVARASKTIATAKPSSSMEEDDRDRLLNEENPETIPGTVDVEQQENDGKNIDGNDCEAMSQTTMEELFGRYEESDQEGRLDRTQVAHVQRDHMDSVLPVSRTGLLREEAIASTLTSNMQPKPTNSSVVEANFDLRPSPAKKITKKLKRKDDDDIFATPSRTPSPHPITTKRDPPTPTEGRLHSTLKRPRTTEVKDEQSSEWPPSRKRRKGDDIVVQDIKVSAVPVSNPKASLSRPQQVHVNAVASSSKLKLPDPIYTNPVQPPTLKDRTADHHIISNPRSVIPETSSNDAPSISKAAQGPKGVPTHQPAKSYVINVDEDGQVYFVPDVPGPPEKVALTPKAPQPTTVVSRLKFHHALPAGPSSDADPFISNVASVKSLGKSRDDSSATTAKPLRRIDLHRESLAKRLRNNSRPSSVMSSRTSTTGSSRNASRRHRTSNSLRQSMAGLDLPEETKEFTVVAAEDLAAILEELAKKHGVSIEIAMKTYLTTRSLEKTKFVLNEFFQCLRSMEQDLYARMPGLRGDPEEEHGSDEDVLDGLVPQNESRSLGGHSFVHNFDHSPSQSISPRKSKRPSLVIKPLRLDDEQLSDYSPPSNSRAGQFLRLVKAGREEEAFAREKRRASGVHVSSTQVHLPPPFSPMNTSPSPRGEMVSMNVDVADEEPHVEEDDDDIYVHTEDEKQIDQEGEDLLGEEEEALVKEQIAVPEVYDDGEDDSGFVSGSSAPTRQASKAPEPRNEFVDNWDLAFAEKYRMLALEVTDKNSDEMRKLEAASDPERVRLASIQWIFDSLAPLEPVGFKEESSS